MKVCVSDTQFEMVKTSASVAPHSPDLLSGAVAGQVQTPLN